MVDFPTIKPLFTYTHRLRSRYSETDQMGYVYYGRYPEFFEEARTEMLRAMNLSYRELEESGVMLPVVSMEIDYKQPVFYDEEMSIHVMVYKRPAIKLETFYGIHTTRQVKPHVKGRVTLCFVDSETRKPMKAPGAFLDALEI